MDASEGDTSEAEEEFLRDVVRQFLRDTYQKIMDSVIKLQMNLMDKKFGPPEMRVGVYGPFTEEKIIDEVAKMVSKLGFIAITGRGFYLPHKPDEIHEIGEITPDDIKPFFELMPDYIKYFHFPRLVSKAVFDENDERGQAVELQGCFEYKIPALGFIVHEKTSGKRNCVYLLDKDTYTECVVTAKNLCPHETPMKAFCPFYDSIDIPWLSKQLLLEKKENRIIAIKNLRDIEGVLKEFLL